MSEEKNKNKDKPASAPPSPKWLRRPSKAAAGEDDCPLCRISPETIAALKKAKKVEQKEESAK